METVLMIVTVVALALAIGMSVMAWRLLRESHHRLLLKPDAPELLLWPPIWPVAVWILFWAVTRRIRLRRKKFAPPEVCMLSALNVMKVAV